MELCKFDWKHWRMIYFQRNEMRALKCAICLFLVVAFRCYGSTCTTIYLIGYLKYHNHVHVHFERIYEL